MSEKRKPSETGAQWVERVMRDRIAKGKYPVGKALPYTQVLAGEFGVGAFTIHRAMRNMYDLLENGRAAGRIVVHTGTGEKPRADPAPAPEPAPGEALDASTELPSVNDEAADDDVDHHIGEAEIARHNTACEPESFRVVGVRKTDREPRVLLELWTLLSDKCVRYEGDLLVHGPIALDVDLARRLGDDLIEMADHAEEKL